MKRQTKAYLYAIAAVLLWATVASAFKLSLRYLDVLQLLLYASLVSAAVLFLLLLGQKKLHLLRRYSTKDYFRAAVLGFLNPFLYYVVLFKAYSLLPAQEAQPLNYTWPILLVLLAVPLLKQKIRPKDMIAIIISFAGVFILATHGNVFSFGVTNATGVLLALGSAVVWALFWIYATRDRHDETAQLFVSFVFGSLFAAAAALFFSSLRFSIPGLAGAAYIGLFEMGIPFVLWSKALRLSETTAKVSTLAYLVPFLSLGVIHVVVGEEILISTVVGLCLIIAGILVSTRK